MQNYQVLSLRPIVLTISDRAVWSGTRIILRQVSPEANSIFDFIMALYHSCQGDWEVLARQANVDFGDVRLFLDYAAIFLSNIGNYYVRVIVNTVEHIKLLIASSRARVTKSLHLRLPKINSQSLLMLLFRKTILYGKRSGNLCIESHQLV